jgi:Co/Zn/Cd efflux system component
VEEETAALHRHHHHHQSDEETEGENMNLRAVWLHTAIDALGSCIVLIAGIRKAHHDAL